MLAKQWLEEEHDLTYDKLHYLVLPADHLSPQRITGAAFQIACALSKMDATMSEPASPVRFASERRVMRLLRSALIFLGQRSADLPSVWKFVVPSRERALLREYGSN